MSTTLAFAIALARWWTHLYTRGLSPEVRDGRRAEVESDLWEHQHDLDLFISPDRTAAHILGRLLLGIPEDLTWRLEQATFAGRVAGRSGIMLTAVRRAGWRAGLMGLTMLLAMFYLGTGVAIWIGGEFSSALEHALSGLAIFVSGLLLFGGTAIARRRPVLGSLLIAVGAIVPAVLMYWVAVVFLPVALVVTGYGIYRARRLLRQRQVQPRAA